MKRFAKKLIVCLVVCVMLTETVCAAPTIGDLKDDKKDAQKELESLETQLDVVMTEIYDLDEQLSLLNEQIAQATTELRETEVLEQQQYEAMKCRIVAMYENGNQSTFALILGARSITEMLKAIENVQTILKYDRKALQQFADTKTKIEQLKTSLESEQSQVEMLYQKQETQMQNLNRMIASQEAKVSDLNKKIKAAEEKAAREAAERRRREQEKNQIVQGGDAGEDGPYTGTGDTGVAAQIVASARSYLGVKYVYGGTSRDGIDCSGLTMRAHEAAGIRIPRTSYYQRRGGKAVNGLENAQPGDILCYEGHVALYIGNYQVIHAPQPGDVVKIASWNMGPNQPLLAIRRYW